MSPRTLAPGPRPLVPLLLALAAALPAGATEYLARQKQPTIVEQRDDAIVVDQFRWGHEVVEGSDKREPRFQRIVEQVGFPDEPARWLREVADRPIR